MTTRLTAIALFCLAPWLVPPLHAEEAHPPAEGAHRLLLEKESVSNGARLKTKVSRVVLPVGYKTPLHTHEAPGPRYVLKGRIKIAESGQSRVYEPGEAFWESGQWMTAENVGEGEVELLIVETNATATAR